MLAMLAYHAKRPYHFVKTGLLQGIPAQLSTNFPDRSLKIFLITGTDGKTTSSTMLFHVLNTAGHKTALLSTVGAYYGENAIDTGFHVTSPQPMELYQFMRQAVNEQCTHMVLEATSHGSYQYRTWGIHPQVAGLTNIAHEHLDYHINYTEYVKAKAALLKKADAAVINSSDQSYKVLSELYPNNDWLPYVEADQLPLIVQKAINDRFSEDYNQMNARLVYTMAKQAHISDEDFAHAIRSFSGIPGRMEVVAEKPCKIIVDFAHTPQGLEAALSAVKKQLTKKGRLIAVYGSAGLRDRQKRPMMGAIGVKLADYVILTAEDPRTEEVWSIIRQMKEQLIDGHDKIISIPDRREAITYAVEKLAGPDDIIIILGKGHEHSMCFGTTEVPWSDQQVIKEVVGLADPNSETKTTI